jgi:hypothetical protein
MTTNVSSKLLETNRLKATDNPRKAFVTAWDAWVRDTAKLLIDAPDFEERTALLRELNVCSDVMDVLCGAAAEDAERRADHV